LALSSVKAFDEFLPFISSGISLTIMVSNLTAFLL
jgi:hypothetical protein